MRRSGAWSLRPSVVLDFDDARRFSMSGSAARTTSPTICRLRALTCSRSSCAVCQVGLSRSMMSTAGTPARRNGMWSSSMVVSSWRTCAEWPSLAAAAQTMSTSQGVEFASRRMRQIAVADHVEQDERLERRERAGLLRRLHVVAAAVGVVVAAPVPSRASSPSRNSSSIVNSFGRCFQHASELEQRRRGRGAVVGADEAEVRGTAWCRSGWRGRCARRGGRESSR